MNDEQAKLEDAVLSAAQAKLEAWAAGVHMQALEGVEARIAQAIAVAAWIITDALCNQDKRIGGAMHPGYFRHLVTDWETEEPGMIAVKEAILKGINHWPQPIVVGE